MIDSMILTILMIAVFVGIGVLALTITIIIALALYAILYVVYGLIAVVYFGFYSIREIFRRTKNGKN